MDEEHLTLSQEFAADRRDHLGFVIGADKRQNRVASFRRCCERRHFSDPGDRHLQRPRNRCCRHGQHIDVGFQRFEGVFVFHPEALLLIHDNKTQVFERHVLAQQTMGPNDDVNTAIGESGQHQFCFRITLEPREGTHVDRERGVTLLERFHMLLHQQSGGRYHRHLLLVLNGFECCPHRNLGFSKPHITGDEAIHRDGSLHVGLHLVNGGELVRGLHERKRLLQLPLPRGVGGEGKPRGCHPGGVKLHEIHGELADRFPCFALGGGPIGAAHFGQRWGIASHIVAELVQLVGGDIETIRWATTLAGGVFQHHKLALASHGVATTGGYFSRHQLHEAPHAVGVVHHIVASGELQGVHHPGALCRKRSTGPRRSAHGFAIKLLLSNHDQFGIRDPEPLVQDTAHHTDNTGAWGTGQFLIDAMRNISLPQHLGASLHQTVTRCHHNHRVSVSNTGRDELPHFLTPGGHQG